MCVPTCARRPHQPPQRRRPVAVVIGRHRRGAYRALVDLPSGRQPSARHVTNARSARAAMCARAWAGRQCRVLGCWECVKGDRRRAPGARRASMPSSYMSMMSVGDGSSRLPPAATTGLATAAAPGARAPAASATSVASAVAFEAGAGCSGSGRGQPPPAAARGLRRFSQQPADVVGLKCAALARGRGNRFEEP